MTDWLELMRAHTRGLSSSEYGQEWMALAMHLAEAHPDEAAAWVSRQDTSVKAGGSGGYAPRVVAVHADLHGGH